MSSLVAGLPIGKPLPVDSFSLITDSALGRSTIAASVTTGGVTQFTEVSFSGDYIPLVLHVKYMEAEKCTFLHDVHFCTRRIVSNYARGEPRAQAEVVLLTRMRVNAF